MKSVGVVGVGYWGKKHVDEYTKLGCKVYVADRMQENLDYCREKFKVAGTYSDLDGLLKNEEVKYVSICTPNATHFPIAKKVLESGKHVLVEKPFVLDSKDGEELIKIAQEKKLNLSVGHIFRFNNAVRYVKDAYEKGELGEPYLIKMSWTNIEPVFGDRDVIFDLAPHPFDIVDYLLGEKFEEISCVGGAYRQDYTEAAFINSRIKNTAVHLEVSWITPRKVRELIFVGSKKTVFADCVRQKVSIYDNEMKNYRDVEIVPNNTIQDELREFIRCADTHNTSVADAEVGMKIVKLLELAEESMKGKEVVKVSF